jgi:cytochrome c
MVFDPKEAHMSSLEINKIAAAVLVAGIIALTASLIAKTFMHQEPLPQSAYPIEVTGAEASPKTSATETVDFSVLMETATIARGQKIFKKCQSCHMANKDGQHRVGPKLWGVIGRQKGAHTDYAYSQAMKDFGGVWDATSLNGYLANPRAYMPKNKMSFVGLKKDQDRADVIKYLQSLAD